MTLVVCKILKTWVSVSLATKTAQYHQYCYRTICERCAPNWPQSEMGRGERGRKMKQNGVMYPPSYYLPCCSYQLPRVLLAGFCQLHMLLSHWMAKRRWQELLLKAPKGNLLSALDISNNNFCHHCVCSVYPFCLTVLENLFLSILRKRDKRTRLRVGSCQHMSSWEAAFTEHIEPNDKHTVSLLYLF